MATDAGGLSDIEAFTLTVNDVPAPTELVIDLKPGSRPNRLYTKGKGAVPAAIMASRDFDVRNIEPSTVKLEG